jgi:TonB family protein
MRWRSAVALVLLGTFLATSGAQGAGSRPADIPAMVARDTVGLWLQGTWKSDVVPESLVKVVPIGGGVIMLRARGRFDAVAFVEGGRFQGTVRTTPGTGKRMGSLRGRWTGEGVIAVEFAGDSAAAPVRRETWKLVDRAGDWAAPHDRPALERSEPGDPDPKLGEYVYVEDLPEALSRVAPEYPAAARKAGAEGTVIVQALVGKDGLVKDTKIITSIPGLDDAAEAAVRQWRFKPAEAKGQPVAVWVAIPVKFTLK